MSQKDYLSDIKRGRLSCFKFPFKAMGCPCEIQLFAAHQTAAKRVAEIAIGDILRLEAKYSRYRRDSLLSKINSAAAKGERIDIDPETASLLNYAETCFQQSDGLFDITSGILRQAWRFENRILPEPKQLDALMARIGWQKLHWQSTFLEFDVPGMELDFGGIVKEYAADRAATLCRQHAMESGVVNLGGDVTLIGPRADNRPWQVGIHHPRQKDGLLTTLQLSTGSVATSGDYQRFMMINGVRYSHIFNPKTGWPVSHLAAVSVISDFCVVSGSASTIAMLKAEEGPAWLETLGLSHLWMDHFGNQGGTLL